MFLANLNGPQRVVGSSHLSNRNANAILESSTTSRSSAGSFSALSNFYDGNTVPTTPTSTQSRETFVDWSREPSVDEAAQSASISHSHWCFTCPNPRLITTCDGWKRHMKEHETSFCCMPNGPIEHTAEGTRCAFCGFRNPDRSHCDAHRAFPCANKSLDVRSYTRKPHFISHLETHHYSDIDRLAKLWKVTIEKKHFACGFCISHFHSLIEQLNHIDTFHYKRSQHVRDWDSNHVIRGLLLQPDVAKSWRGILASHPAVKESLLRWDPSVIKELQYRLEMGNDPPETLAKIAFDQTTHSMSLKVEYETVNSIQLSLLDGVTEPQQVPMTQATAPFQLSSKENPFFNEYTLDSSVLPTTQHEWSYVIPGGFLPAQDHIIPRSVPDNPELRTTTKTQHPYLDTSQSYDASDGHYRTQSEPVTSNTWTSSSSYDFTSTTSDSVTMSNYWQATPVSSPTNSPSSMTLDHQPRYQTQSQTQHGWGKTIRSRYTSSTFPPSAPGAGNNTSSPIMNYQSSSSGLIIAPTNLGGSIVGGGQQARKQSSRSKLKDHYDINTEADTDLDFDNLQRFMREEDCTRTEKRRR